MHLVDARGLKCPMPLLRAKQALNKANSSECIKVILDDNRSERDFLAFINLTDHQMVEHGPEEDYYFYVIKKGSV